MAGEQDVVCLVRVANPQKAHLWRQVLEDEGIHCEVVGDYLDAGFGSLDTIEAELWVHKSDAERAGAILEAQAEAAESSNEEGTEEEE